MEYKAMMEAVGNVDARIKPMRDVMRDRLVLE